MTDSFRSRRRTRRAVTATGFILGGALVTAGLAPVAQAADSYPPSGDAALGAAQPTFAGYRIRDILDWSPQTDPHAELLRARIPLQPRIEPLRATQANPELTGDAQVLLMQGDYGNAFFGSTPNSGEFSEHALNFWQYTDIYAPWHGAATASTPQALYDPATSDWRNRGFEFGSVNVPNPAYTDAAHRNGAKSIATIYFDPAFRPGVSVDELMLERRADGTFPVADKLIEMAGYFGYDGYFFNKEEHSALFEDGDFKAFMAYLTAHGMYTNYYDVNSSIDDAKVDWLRDDAHGRIHDSLFVNYGWPSWASDESEWQRIRTEYGPDLYDEFFLGVEANQGGFGGGHPTASEFSRLYEPGSNDPRTSVALFTPSDFYQRALDDALPGLRGTEPLPLMQTDEYQWMITERERMYFSGVRSDVTQTGEQAGFARPDVGVPDAGQWVGVADFTPERSVAGGSRFASWFNTGHGVGWWEDGEASSSQEWTNIAIQSLLPSWQWWFQTSSGNPSGLRADFDYGPGLDRKGVDGQIVETPFQRIGAYRGGSSLAIYGDLGEDTTMRLFKTDLGVERATTVDVTYAAPAGGAAVQLAVVYADAPDEVETYPLGQSSTGWRTASVDLGAQTGRRIATLGVTLSGAQGAVQVNLGGVQVRSGNATPTAPSGFSVDRLYSSGEALLSWDLQPFTEVDSYQVYAVRGGTRTWLGGTYDAALHVDDLDLSASKGDLTLELVAIGKDGSVSKPASRRISLSAAVSSVTVKESAAPTGLLTQAADAGAVEVSWKAPASPARVGGYLVRLTPVDVTDPEPVEVRVPASARTAVVPVADPEGRTYDVSVAPLNPGGKPRGDMAISYRGETHDSFAAPYLAADVVSSAEGWRLTPPSCWDWRTLTVSYDGVEQFTATRGGNDANRTLLGLRAFPEAAQITVVLTDYAGNRSEPLVLDVAALRAQR
ncbi:MAG: hypothetical protein J7484_12720 [Microbacterium sp.]|nr:hypothetical protein [Microbacterium sp.]